MRVINSGMSRFIFYVSVALAIIMVFEYFVYASSNKKENIKVDGIILSIEEKEVLDLINEERKENGLSELQVCEELQKVAQIKAEDMVNNDYFSHTSPTYGTPFDLLKSEGVDYKIAGENLAGNVNGVKAVNAWMNSQTHKDNILDDNYEYTGISVVNSEIYGKVYVQFFMGI